MGTIDRERQKKRNFQEEQSSMCCGIQSLYSASSRIYTLNAFEFYSELESAFESKKKFIMTHRCETRLIETKRSKYETILHQTTSTNYASSCPTGNCLPQANVLKRKCRLRANILRASVVRAIVSLIFMNFCTKIRNYQIIYSEHSEIYQRLMIQDTLHLTVRVIYITWNVKMIWEWGDKMTKRIKVLKVYRLNLNLMHTLKREGRSGELVILWSRLLWRIHYVLL